MTANRRRHNRAVSLQAYYDQLERAMQDWWNSLAPGERRGILTHLERRMRSDGYARLALMTVLKLGLDMERKRLEDAEHA